MSLDGLNQNSQCSKQDLEEWLNEIALLDGKCCYVSKKSQLRSKLLSTVSRANENEEEIVKIFDEKLWKHDGNIYEVNSAGLRELQDVVSINLPFQRVESKDNFDLKYDFFIFTLNQSTLLALLISSIIFSRAILKIFNYVYALGLGLSWMYFLTFFIVISVIDHGSKRFWLSMGVGIVAVHVIFYLIYIPPSSISEYVGVSEIVKLCLFFLFNMVLLGAALFSSLYSVEKFVGKKVRSQKIVGIFMALFIYAFLIVVFIQGVSTVTIN